MLPLGKIVALLPQQLRFCLEYTVDFHGTAAAIRAGYRESHAAGQACRLLTQEAVQAEIKRLTAKQEAKINFSAESVLRELARSIHFDPRKLYDAAGNLKPIPELDDDTAMALAGVEVVEMKIGDSVYPMVTKKIKWADRNAAIAMGMKHFGIQGSDKSEHTGAGGEPLMPPMDPQELARRIAFTLRSAIEVST